MIDSHHHLWQYTQAEYPWIPRDSELANNYVLDELHAVTSSAGVAGSVAVQARQSITETRWLLDLAARSPVIRGVVGWLPLVDEGIENMLDEWQHESRLKGLRHVLQEEADDYFTNAAFHRGLTALAQTHLRYDLLIYERQLDVATAMIDLHPDLPIIIDHIAKPEIHHGRISERWKNGMRELAQRDHVIAVKISGMATEVRDAEVDEATLRAYFEETLAIFGANKLMFGSDWPVCLLRLDSYQQCAYMMRSFVASLSECEQKNILTNNAVRCYDL